MSETKIGRGYATIDPEERPARTKVRRLLPLGLAGTIAVAALLLLATPLAAATHPVAYFGAPYTAGKVVQYRDPGLQGCGAGLTVKTAATFNLATGKGTGWAIGSASPCATADSQASYDGIVGVQGLHFTPSTSGVHSIVAHWIVTWGATATMTAAAANAGAQATVEIWLQVQLTDLTTAKTTIGNMVFIVQKDLQSAGSFSGGVVAGKYTAGIASAALTAGHHYALYTVLAYDLQAVVPAGSPVGADVSAAVDLGSAAHGGALTSVVVS